MKNYIKQRQMQENELPPVINPFFSSKIKKIVNVPRAKTEDKVPPPEEKLPEFIGVPSVIDISEQAKRKLPYWETLFISGGRKDKISKGDIAGMFFKIGKLTKDQLGIIELKRDCAFVAVPISIADELVKDLNNKRLKKKKIRVTKI